MTNATNGASDNSPYEPNKNDLAEQFRQWQIMQQHWQTWLNNQPIRVDNSPTFLNHLRVNQQRRQPELDLAEMKYRLAGLATILCQLQAGQNQIMTRLDQTITRLDRLTDANLALRQQVINLQFLLSKGTEDNQANS